MAHIRPVSVLVRRVHYILRPAHMHPATNPAHRHQFWEFTHLPWEMVEAEGGVQSLLAVVMGLPMDWEVPGEGVAINDMYFQWL